jgi:hypothetical protein
VGGGPDDLLAWGVAHWRIESVPLHPTIAMPAS